MSSYNSADSAEEKWATASQLAVAWDTQGDKKHRYISTDWKQMATICL